MKDRVKSNLFPARGLRFKDKPADMPEPRTNTKIWLGNTGSDNDIIYVFDGDFRGKTDRNTNEILTYHEVIIFEAISYLQPI